MAIDWSTAPEWAAHLVVGPYGSLYSEKEPELIFAEPPYYETRGMWQRICYASCNAAVFTKPTEPQHG